ncbi:MAG: SIS domain-containing protein [bacterium]|nr:SIS domain-containing protein [bacterium]
MSGEKSNIETSLRRRMKLLRWTADEGLSQVREIAGELSKCLASGGAVFVCGNGGSASQAEHLAGELVGRFKKERDSLRVFALTADSAVVTALANDYGYDEVFSRQLNGMARRGDCLLALSTSGESKNIVKACETAKKKGARVFALTGQGGGTVGAVSEACLAVPDSDTARIQEIHLLAIHLICQLVEESMTSPATSRSGNV